MEMNFFKQIISSTEDSSSKRFNGTVGFITVQCIVLFLAIHDMLKDGILSALVGEIINYDLIVSASLLGVTAIEKIWTNKNKNT